MPLIRGVNFNGLNGWTSAAGSSLTDLQERRKGKCAVGGRNGLRIVAEILSQKGLDNKERLGVDSLTVGKPRKKTVTIKISIFIV